MFRTPHDLVVAAVLTASATNVFGQLCNISGFEDPPIEYRTKFRYWLPDASISADIVARDIHDIQAAGAGGLEFLPFYLYGEGPESFERAKLANPAYVIPEIPDWSTYGFGTKAFNALFSSALQTANHNGVLMDFAVGPNQGAGVPSELGVLGLAVQLLMGNTTIQPGESFSGPVPQAQQPIEAITTGLGFQHPQRDYFAPNLTALTAYEVLSVENNTGISVVTLKENSFLDLMPLLTKNGSLQWTPPDNTKTWKVFGFYESYTNQRACDGGYNATTIISNGSWIVDHFSAAGAAKTTDFWDNYILTDVELAERLTAAGHYSWEDSMEQIAALYWTPNLLNLSKEASLDIHPYLPALFDASNTWGGFAPPYNGESFRFSTNGTSTGASKSQLNYRAMLNAGYQEYLMHLRNWSRSMGIKGFSTQPAYNLPLLMSSDIALLDAPEGESLGFQQSLDAYRQFSGPAHLANISVISTELGAVSGPPYSLQVPDLLQQIKRSFSGGFTTNVLHGYPAMTPYAETTWPGYTPFFYRYTEMWNPIQPAWKHMKEQLDYIGRNQWILQQGSPQIDLAFYYYKDPWLPTLNYNSTNLQDLGFTYDYLGPKNLASEHAYMRDGTVGVPTYKALISDHQTVITVEAASALLNLALSGLPIIFIGPAPSQVTPVDASLQAKLDGMMRLLMSNANVYNATTKAEVPALLSQRNITPRVALNCSSDPVFPVYRSAGTTDYIFFFNDQPIDATCTATLHAHGVVPILYNAWTGTKSPLLQYTTSNSSLSIPIALRSNETLILALEKAGLQPDYMPKHSSGALYALATTLGPSTMAIITGATQFTCKNSETLHVEDPILPAPLNLSTWSLVVQDWHSVPDRYAIETAVTNHTYAQVPLVPWVEIDPALQHVSGMGVYKTRFTTPPSLTTTTTNASTNLIGILSLPLIQHTARAYLDSTLLAPIDPTNPIVSFGPLQLGREYELRLEVSTTLFNRVKAEANQTLFIGQKVTELQTLYTSLAFTQYGLVGNVQLQWGIEVEVEC